MLYKVMVVGGPPEKVLITVWKMYYIKYIIISSIPARRTNNLNNDFFKFMSSLPFCFLNVTKILIGIVYGQMVFISQITVLLYCPKTF